jgi:UDP-N-acetylglucosamine---dolichyl-phosphate N-acetylglucosaminyltransferase
MRGLIVIPAFNEEKIIGQVLAEIPQQIEGYQFDAVVINDGSSDNTEQVIKKMGTTVINHPINRGLGAALGTGFEYARLKGYDLLVTLDADGQHDPKEINKLIKPVIEGKADFVVGTRIRQKGMPATRKIITFAASLSTYLFTGAWTSDSQSGFRAFSKKAIDNIFIEVDRMEVSSDFFRQAQEKRLKVVEVPITPIYTKYSLKKGQNFFNSFNILGKLALRKLIN